MEKRTTVLITFIFVIALIASLYVFTDWFSKVTGYFSGESEIRSLIECMNNEDYELYTSEFCAECEKQTKLFGDLIRTVNRVECGGEMENCPNIVSIPAWFIKNEIHYGYKSLDELKTISGCGA